jgi:hypothetical protein
MAEGFVPPQEVRSNARRGLELRKKYGRGGTEVGVARARDLSNGSSLSLSTINRMVSYFARHEVDKKGEGWGKDSAGYIAWLLWGGDAGRSWANRIARENKKKTTEKSMINDLTTAFFEIVKADRNDDGTLMVYGKATDDSLDIDQQICDPTWLDDAMPEWFKSGGNIREQHSNIAAGVAKEYEKKKDGHYIHALVVDPVSVKKVDTGVLKGFSIGIKNPRVVRDQKAANGRIIAGKIVEVSLVDRPANPNCQLVLAKSAEGQSNLFKVEELIEKEEKKPNYAAINSGGEGSEPSDKELYNRVKNEAKDKFDVYPSAVANAWVVREYKKRGGTYKKKTDKGVNTLELPYITEGEAMSNLVDDIIELSKSYAGGDLLKFDRNTYDNARQALAQLIAIEAQEMNEGSNEESSLTHLIAAVHHLFAWYQGEEAEGETMENEQIEMAAGSDKMNIQPKKGESKDDFMKRCKAKGMNDKDAGICADKFYKDAHKVYGDDDTDKKKESSKSTDAESTEPTEVAEVAEVTEEAPVVEEKKEEEVTAVEETPAEQVSEEKISSEEVEAIVEQAIKSATQSIKTEIASLVSAKEAALSKAVSLESELAIAKSLAVAGGPKRTGTSVAQSNDLFVKAATYKAKAQATTDPVLAKGYKQLADEFFAKASEPDATK